MMKNLLMSRTVGTLAVLGLLIAACAGDEPTADEAATQEPAATETAAAQEPTATTAAQEPAVVAGAATLEERNSTGVSGEASLRWDPDSGVMSVTVDLDGLEEGTTYLAIIASGCQPPMQRIHALGNTPGGADGTGHVTAEVADVGTVDLDGGWTVVVARPQVGPQACGELGPA